MLTLTRFPGERLLVDTPDGLITIEVVELRKGHVRIGIDAPRAFTIEREEVRRPHIKDYPRGQRFGEEWKCGCGNFYKHARRFCHTCKQRRPK